MKIDPIVAQAIIVSAIELLLIPIFVYVVKRTVGKRLDDFDERREIARLERQERFEADKKWQDSITHGMRSILRSEIVSEHRKWMERGFCPLESKEYLARCHEAYVGVGGNSIGDSLYNEVMALPNNDPKEA